MNLATKVTIIESIEGKRSTSQVTVPLTYSRDLWELRSLLFEALGSHPSVLTIDDNGLGVAEYYGPLEVRGRLTA